MHQPLNEPCTQVYSDNKVLDEQLGALNMSEPVPAIPDGVGLPTSLEAALLPRPTLEPDITGKQPEELAVEHVAAIAASHEPRQGNQGTPPKCKSWQEAFKMFTKSVSRPIPARWLL